MNRRLIVGALLGVGVVTGGTAGVGAAEAPAGSLAQATEPTLDFLRGLGWRIRSRFA